MKYFLSLFILTGFFVQAVCSQLPPGIPPEGRLWILRPDTETRFQKGLSVADSDTYTAKFEIDEKMLKEDYALWIDVERGAELEPSINGIPLASPPLRTSRGQYFYIGGGTFDIGLNSLEIRKDSSLPPQEKQIALFSLLDGFEAAHFHRIFSDKKLLVQPPAHPSQELFDALHYDLDMILTMTAAVVDATLTMESAATAPLSEVVLDLDAYQGALDVQWVDSGPQTASLSFNHEWAEDWLHIALPSEVPEGATFTVRVRYAGEPAPNEYFSGTPAFGVGIHNNTPVVSTLSEPYGARSWWPCKDLPHDKATMDLHFTCPAEYIPISNGILTGVITHPDGTHTYHWSETYPMATYLASVSCTDYAKVADTYTSQDGTSTMEVAHFVYPEHLSQQAGAIGGTLEVLDFFSSTFCEYPFLREKYYTASHSSGVSMEHQTATSLNPTILNGGGTHWINVHELAHQWFGDMITMEHFDHLWLNEGFATYSEALWAEHEGGPGAYHEYVNRWSTNDSIPLVGPNADRFYGSVVYRKGAWVLHMLRNVVGDEGFFASIRDYCESPALKYGTALSEDLQSVFEARTGEDLDWFFDQWLYRTGRPHYQWAWSAVRDGSSVRVEIYLRQIQAEEPFRMPIDFRLTGAQGQQETITLDSDSRQQSFRFTVVLEPPLNVELDPENWILKNESVLQEAGVQYWQYE